MTTQSILSSLVLGVAALTGCGQTLDVGSNPEADVAGAIDVAGASGARNASGTKNGNGNSGGSAAGAAAGGALQQGGAAGLSGSGPDDAGGACDCIPDPELEPVRIIRGQGDEGYWDLTVIGARLDANEGKVVTVRIGDAGTRERLGSGQARIEDGTFQLSFPKVWEAETYKGKLVYIDIDEDGACTPDVDAVFSDATASEYHLLTVGPDYKEIPASFWPSYDPQLDCAKLNEPWPTE